MPHRQSPRRFAARTRWSLHIRRRRPKRRRRRLTNSIPRSRPPCLATRTCGTASSCRAAPAGSPKHATFLSQAGASVPQRQRDRRQYRRRPDRGRHSLAGTPALDLAAVDRCQGSGGATELHGRRHPPDVHGVEEGRAPDPGKRIVYRRENCRRRHRLRDRAVEGHRTQAYRGVLRFHPNRPSRSGRRRTTITVMAPTWRPHRWRRQPLVGSLPRPGGEGAVRRL